MTLIQKTDRRVRDLSLFSERQKEVLRLIAEGLTCREIGVELRVSRKTVEYHRAQIGAVLGLHTIAELARFAMQTGLVGPISGVPQNKKR